MEQEDWPLIFTRAMREVLEDMEKCMPASFVSAVAEFDPALYDAGNIVDPAFNAVWNFADHFCDAYNHGSGDVGGISWNEAAPLFRAVAERLERNEPVDDPRVLGFEWPKRRKRRHPPI